MSNITSLQIGENKIRLGNYIPRIDLTNKVPLATKSDFTTTTINTLDYQDFTYTATEDCYVQFSGLITTSENQLWVIQSDGIAHSRHMINSQPWYTFTDDAIFMPKGTKYVFRLKGFDNYSITKFGILKD